MRALRLLALAAALVVPAAAHAQIGVYLGPPVSYAAPVYGPAYSPAHWVYGPAGPYWTSGPRWAGWHDGRYWDTRRPFNDHRRAFGRRW